jgi:hypothetical protein
VTGHCRRPVPFLGLPFLGAISRLYRPPLLLPPRRQVCPENPHSLTLHPTALPRMNPWVFCCLLPRPHSPASSISVYLPPNCQILKLWAGHDAKLCEFFLNAKWYYCVQQIGFLVFTETLIDFAHISLQNTCLGLYI